MNEQSDSTSTQSGSDSGNGASRPRLEAINLSKRYEDGLLALDTTIQRVGRASDGGRRNAFFLAKLHGLPCFYRSAGYGNLRAAAGTQSSASLPASAPRVGPTVFGKAASDVALHLHARSFRAGCHEPVLRVGARRTDSTAILTSRSRTHEQRPRGHRGADRFPL